MKIAISKITGTSIRETGKRLVKALRFGTRDVVEVHLVGPAGIDSAPIKNLRTVIVPTSLNGRAVAVGVIENNQKADPGELRLFSVDSDGNEKTYIYLKSDGNIELAGSGDFAVRFNDLESGFDQLKSDLNTFMQVYNGHTHLDPVSGSTGGPSAPGTASTASIASAKVDEIEVPGS